MARCSCGGGTCSCVIQGGSGIVVGGAGSSGNPYTIDATGDFTGSIIPIPTDTVLMSVTGSGSDTDPILISARATVSMTELDDVSDATPPQEGEVPVWTVDHWEFKIPASAPPGTVNRGAGLIGDGSAGNPLLAAISGNWQQGDMVGFPADTLLGQSIYTDVAGQLRARPTPIVRHNEDPVLTYAAGWKSTVGGYTFWSQWGPMVFVIFDVTRTGATIVGGDISNAVGPAGGTFATALRAAMPAPLHFSSLAGGGIAGPLTGGFVAPAKSASFGSIDKDFNFVTGGRYTLAGVYMGDAAVGSVLL